MCACAVAKLIRKKREREGGVPLDKPVTIVLIDDRKHDAWGNCQVSALTHSGRHICTPSPRACRLFNLKFRPVWAVPFEAFVGTMTGPMTVH